MNKETQKKVDDLEECLAGFIVAGAINGMYVNDDMKNWCVKKLTGKQRTPVQIWNELFNKQ